MKKRTKSRSLTQKKKELWKYFSAYIRNRDGFTCFSCGKYATGGGLHAGHFVPNSIGGISLRFDPENVHAQCYHCNINLSGNWPNYREKMIQKYGEPFVVELEARRHQVCKDFDYDAEIQKYKNLCEQMGITVR